MTREKLLSPKPICGSIDRRFDEKRMGYAVVITMAEGLEHQKIRMRCSDGIAHGLFSLVSFFQFHVSDLSGNK